MSDLSDVSVRCISIPPELAASTTETTRRHIDEALDGCRRLILKCSAVQTVDSGGLRLLLETTRLGHARGVQVVLAEPSPELRLILRLAGVWDYVHVDSYDVDLRGRITLSAATMEAIPGSHGPAVHDFPVAHAI